VVKTQDVVPVVVVSASLDKAATDQVVPSTNQAATLMVAAVEVVELLVWVLVLPRLCAAAAAFTVVVLVAHPAIQIAEPVSAQFALSGALVERFRPQTQVTHDGTIH
jgi:hypothetical protein